MRWAQPEELASVLVVCAIALSSVVLLIVRRPALPVQVIDQPPAGSVVVQVDGEVLHPGIYQLPAGARVADAVRAAGGPSAHADAGAVNQARLLRDGDRLTLPARQVSPAVSKVSRVFINTAGEQELVSLPGVGPVLARRIIAHRTREGAYQRVEDLLRVEGIGPKLLERLRPLVVVD